MCLEGGGGAHPANFSKGSLEIASVNAGSQPGDVEVVAGVSTSSFTAPVRKVNTLLACSRHDNSENLPSIIPYRTSAPTGPPRTIAVAVAVPVTPGTPTFPVPAVRPTSTIPAGVIVTATVRHRAFVGRNADTTSRASGGDILRLPG